MGDDADGADGFPSFIVDSRSTSSFCILLTIFFFIDRIFGLSFKTRFKGMHRKDPDTGKGRAKSKVRIVFVVISGGG